MTKNAVESRSAIPTCLNFGMASLLFLFSCISLTAQDSKSWNSSLLQNKIDYGQFFSQHDLVWEELPLQWNEGAFTGNAHLGMMVFASLKENRIDFHIGRQDVTDHRKAPDKKSSIGTPGAGVMYDFPRLDLGRLVLHPAGKIISGTMRVDLWNAEIRGKIITSLGEVSFRVFAPYHEMVQIIEVNSTEKDQGKKVSYQWKFLPGNPSSPRAIVFPDNKESKEYVPNPKPVLTRENNINLCVQSLIAGGDYATAWTEKKGTKTGQSTLYITTANEVPAVGISKEVAVRNINRSVSQDIARIEQSHRNSWHQFYSKSFLSIPDVQMESFYWIQLYKMGTCSRPDGPAVDLNGPYFRVTQWPGLWWNLNVQLTYWLVYESNHLEMGENLITLIDECFETLLTRFKGPKLGDLAWAMHNYWLHFSYAGDRKAIQEKWVPKARKIAALYEEMEQMDPSGKIGLLPMESPEYKGFALYTNSSYNLAIYRWLLSTLIESCAMIDANSQEVAKWRHTLVNLVPFSVDQNGIRIGSDQAVDMSHRHYSHLLGLYPLFQLNPDSPEDRALVDKSVVHWHKIGDGKGLAGYSYTGAASLYAALGRGNDAESILHHFLTGSIGISQLLSNTFYVESGGKNPVIETPLSAASSIMELLLQSWGNKIRIFPAVPDRWKNASFNDLRARGGFLVSASRTNGETDWVQIKSLAGERCIVKIPGWTNAFQAVKGKKYEIASLGNNEFKINLAVGDLILLTPSAAPVKAIVQPVKHLTDGKNLYGVKKGKQLPNNQNWPEPDGYAQSIFVSPDGNDKNPGTKERPLASFHQAQKLVRKIPTDQTVEVIFANGIYYLPQTVKFTSDDNRKSFVWKAEEEGKAILSGGSLLKLTWKPYKNGIFVASVSGNPVIDQLYINGTRQRMARFPNAISGKNVFDTWDLSHQAKPDPANDPLTPERIARWNKPEGGYIHAMHSALWGDMHWIIKGKNADGTLNDEGGWQNNRPSKMHPVYRMVENIYEELDAPGEWFFNAKEQKLYYMPETGLDLSIAKVEIVRLKHLIELNGSKEAAVKNVHFKGFVFRHTTRTFMDNKEPLLRSDWTVYRGGAVVFNGAEDCSISDSEFDQVGGNTIFVNNYNRRITIRGCYIHYSGANGIAFVGDPASVRSPLFRYGKQDYSTIDRTPGPKGDNFPEDCLVEDCLITMTCRDEKQTAPVHISMSHKIRVNHCSIYDVPRAGININEGTFGGHIIENCDVFNTVLETGDHGSFNSWGRDRFWTPDINETIPEVAKDPGLPLLDMLEPNIIRNSRWRCDHGWDIDLDDGSTNYRIYNNLLLSGGLKMREGYNRTATNNIIINNGLHPHVWYLNSGDVFKNNIIFKAYQPAIMNKSIPANGKWGHELDSNFYVATKEVMNKFANNGCDGNSLNGDPFFINPTKGDFRVSENSPALKSGFVNFPMNQFGVTKPSLRAIAKKAEIPPFTIKLDVQQPKAIQTVYTWMQIELKEPAGEELSAFGVGFDSGGVALTIVPENSDAYKLGFRSGDLIQEINGTRISTIQKLLQYTSAQTKKSQKQLVQVFRDQAKLTIRIKELLLPVQY